MAAGDGRTRASIGRWHGDPDAIATTPGATAALVHRVCTPVYAVLHEGRLGLTTGGEAVIGVARADGVPLLGVSPPCPPEYLGDAGFLREHGVRLAYVAGAMAGGIASVELVEAMAQAGMLAFFGAAGLSVARVEAAIDRLSTRLLDRPWGANLIHSPYEPALEAAVADLYLRRGVRRVSASAYLRLTAPLVRYRLHGIHRAPDGRVVAPNRVIAKVSRVEVATRFLSPAPEALLRKLVETGALTAAEASLAGEVPIATDVTVEADSGGHTDNRPALTLVPTMIALRDRLVAEHGFANAPRVGAAGGIGTPHAAAAAFAMGAAYVMTGTINQACVEAGTSDAVRTMLAQARQADVTMAPAADMFEMGVQLQVLKRGTMFPMRARKLWDAYAQYDGLEAIEPARRAELERSVLGASLDEVWRQTEAFWADRDPAQLQRAASDSKHRMALCFRWYLGQASRWANAGVPERRADYQVWCGPAIGAFNAWTRGTFLERPEQRRVVAVADNVMHGAAVLSRVASLRAQGVQVPSVDVAPRRPGALQEAMR